MCCDVAGGDPLLPAKGELDSMIAEGASLGQVLEAIVMAMEAASPGLIGSILLIDSTGRRLLTGAAPSLPRLYNELIEGVEIGPGIGSCAHAAYVKKPILVYDVHDHPNWAPFLELARLAKIRACSSAPILSVEGGRVLGTVAVYHAQPIALGNRAIDLMFRAVSIVRYVIGCYTPETGPAAERQAIDTPPNPGENGPH